VGASLAFAAVLIGASWLLLRLRGHNPASAFDPADRVARVAVGLAIGALAASVCALVVRSLPAFAKIRRLAYHAIEGIEPRWHTMVCVALAAGIGEELFFRGALEPAIGRWFTGAAFVALHGALRIRDRGALAFAVFLLAASLGLSALNAWKGLEAAMAAHAGYDLAMLVWLARLRGGHEVTR
jgi:membrane protease YdiL (CAAX protease family)